MRFRKAMAVILGFFAFNMSAYAVPGWAETSRDILNTVPGWCRVLAEKAIKQVTGYGPLTRNVSSNAFLSKGFITTTGVLVYCMPTAEHYQCGAQQIPRTTLTIVAFDQTSLQNAVQIRDAVNTTIGVPSIGAWCL